MLRDNGYTTSAFGKWHLTPDNQQGPTGPFNRWPNALGFDYFWGFLGAETSQYDPLLTENNTILGVPRDENYYFPDAMAERAVIGSTCNSRKHPISHSSYTSLRVLRTHHITCPKNGPIVCRKIRSGVGQASRGNLCSAEATRRDSCRCQAHAA